MLQVGALGLGLWQSEINEGQRRCVVELGRLAGAGPLDPCLPGSTSIVSWSVWTQWRAECESTW